MFVEEESESEIPTALRQGTRQITHSKASGPLTVEELSEILKEAQVTATLNASMRVFMLLTYSLMG